MKKLSVLALVALFATSLWAVKSGDNARAAAERWGGHRRAFGGRAGAAVERVSRHEPSGGDDFFSVRFSGGGTAFVTGDRADELPIAFTDSTNDFSVIDRSSALWALLERDAKARKLAGVRRQALTATSGSPISSDASISDMRVPPLVKSKWNQGGGIYNYYTPKNYVCGCVATAMAQVMRYHEYPKDSRAQIKRKCYVNEKGADYTTQGGTYDWANMPLVPSSPTETQKQAIGKLTSDAGIAVYMSYSSGGSGAYDWNVPAALMDGFGYRSAIAFSADDLASASQSCMFANFDAGFPVILGITGDGGHCIVGDGYGYEGGLPYVHLNLGWGGKGDVWYNLPNIPTTDYNFNVVDDIIANIFPTNGLGAVTVSGRVTDGDSPIGSVPVKLCSNSTGELLAETVANAYGVWGFVTTGGVYRVKVQCESGAGDCLVTVIAQSTRKTDFYGYAGSKQVNYTCSAYADTAANSYGNEIVLVGSNQVKMPVADIPAGTIAGSAYVTLTCATAGAQIRYTLDGTEPTATSTLYSGPVFIDRACTLKAKAFKSGLTASAVMTVVYGWHRAPKTFTVAADGSGDFVSLSNAVWNAIDGDVFRVRPGKYRGFVEVPEDARVVVESTDGPAVTIIDGDQRGCCFYGWYSQDSIVSGFTLTNGWRQAGGGICGGIATNCVIVGCWAENGGGAYGCTVIDCEILGCDAYYYGGGAYDCMVSGSVIRDCSAEYGGGGASGAELIDCVIDGCRANYGGGAYNSMMTDCAIANCAANTQGGGASLSTLVNCTVRGNSAGAYRTCQGMNYSLYAGGGLDCQCLCTNTLSWGNSGPGGGMDDWEWYREPYGRQYDSYAPTFSWCCTSDRILYGANSITNDPEFLSVDALDPRLCDFSPCIGAGYGGVNVGAYRGSGVVTRLPEIDPRSATAAEVAAAVAQVEYADQSVKEGIGTSAETYVEFQTWSTNGLRSQDVLLSSQAFESFLVREIVSAPTLLTGGTNSEIEVTAPGLAENGKFSVTVSLVDGDTVVPLRAAKEAFVAKTLVGSELLALAPADPSKVTAASAADGKSVTLTIEPPAEANRYFMRIKLD